MHRLARPVAGVCAAIVIAAGTGADAPDLERPTSRIDDIAALAPRDGKWLTDDDGRQYYLERIAKTEAQRRPNGTVVSPFGIELLVEREDDRYFYYKVFRVTGEGFAPAPDELPPAESYRVTTKPSSRFRLAELGRGLPTSGQWRNAFAITDLDGDDDLDLVSGPPRKSKRVPRMFLNEGRGTWRTWSEFSAPGRYDYGAAAAGDLNGDRTTDLAFGMHQLGVTALAGDGHGRFEQANRGLDAPDADGTPGAFSSQAIELVDWDADDDLDLVALGEGPILASGERSLGLTVYLNERRGRWERHHVDSPVFGTSLAVGDIDGDHRPDAVAGSNRGDTTEILFLGRGDDGAKVAPLPGLRRNAYVGATAIDDLDDDGRNDIAIGYLSTQEGVWRTGVDVFLRRGGGWQRRALAVGRSRTGFRSIATGDIDGDERTDLVAVNGDGELLVFAGSERDGFTRERDAPRSFGDGCAGSHVELADVDGDGGDEVIASFADEPERGDCPSGGGFAVWTSKT